MGVFQRFQNKRQLFRTIVGKCDSKANALPVLSHQTGLRWYSPTPKCLSASLSSSSSSTPGQPELYEVPTLPIVGSVISFHSGIPTGLMQNDFRSFYPAMRKKFGDFYKFGIPGVGRGIRGEIYVITDPKEMMKVLRQESSKHYPNGGVQAEWPFIKHLKAQKSALIGDRGDDGFFGQGETWKRQRTFLQTDLLSPQAAKGYIPGIAEAAQIASKNAPQWSSDMNSFCQRASFDMFSSLMFGELTKTVDPVAASEENKEFCKHTSTEIRALFDQVRNPMEKIWFDLGFETELYKKMTVANEVASAIGQAKIDRFKSRAENNELSEREQRSYLALSINRQRKEGTVSEEELVQLLDLALHGGVDTTSSFLGWCLCHLAANPDVQEKLQQELSASVAKEGGVINYNVLKRSTSPYLHAFVREVHRVTPAVPTNLMKSNGASDVDIHGVTIPKDSLFWYDSYSIGIDPEYVDHPEEFQPERWLAHNVEARKGTQIEIIDHPFNKDPFSQGSRKCPGSRVANNELLILTTQLALDWKIQAPDQFQKWADFEYEDHGLFYPKIPSLAFEPRSS